MDLASTSDLNARFETLEGRPAAPFPHRAPPASFAGLRFSERGLADYKADWNSVPGHDPAAIDALLALPMPADEAEFEERWRAVHRAGTNWPAAIEMLATIARLDAAENDHG